MNMPIRLISVLPMLMLVAALIATACESASPNSETSSQNNFAAAAPTATAIPTTTPTPQHTQTPTPTAMPDTRVSCEPGFAYPAGSRELQVCLAQKEDICPSDSDLDPPDIVIGGEVFIIVCDPPPTPMPVYQKLTGGLSAVAEAYEQGASAQSAAGLVPLGQALRDNLLTVVIYIDTDPKELVIWLNDNGAEFGSVHGTLLVNEEWLMQEGGDIDDHYNTILLDEYIGGEVELEPPYEGGMTDVVAGVPVSLLVRLSQQPGVIEVTRPFPAAPPYQQDSPPEPQGVSEPVEEMSKPAEIVRPTAAPIETEGLLAHGVRSWHRSGYTGRGVKIGIIDTGFSGLAEIMRNGDFPSGNIATRCYGNYGDAMPSFSDCSTGR